MPVALLTIVLVLLTGPFVPAHGQPSGDEPPERLTLLVPAGAGGGTDAVARRLALLLNEPLGRPVVVVNRPGREGRDALDALRAARPDGLTLALVTGHAMRHQAEPARAISPVFLFNLDAPVLHLQRGDDPQAALAAVLAGRSDASGGPDHSPWHLALAALARTAEGSLPAGAWRPVPRATAAVARLERGDLRLVVAEAAQGAAGRRAGELDLVADGAVLPRAGIERLGGWRGLAGPPGMSKKATEKVAVAARQIVGRDDFRRFLSLRGYTPADLGPTAFADFLDAFARDLARARQALE